MISRMSCLLGLLELGLLRQRQGIMQPVKQDKELSVVIFIRGVMVRVVPSTHDRLRVHSNGVVDVGGPDSSEEEQADVGPEVDGHNKEPHDVRGGLQHSVDWVER